MPGSSIVLLRRCERSRRCPLLDHHEPENSVTFPDSGSAGSRPSRSAGSTSSAPTTLTSFASWPTRRICPSSFPISSTSSSVGPPLGREYPCGSYLVLTHVPGTGFEPVLHFKWKGGLSLGFRVRPVRSRPDIHVLCGRTVRHARPMWHDPVGVGESRDLFGTFAVRGPPASPKVVGIEESTPVGSFTEPGRFACCASPSASRCRPVFQTATAD